MEGLVFLSAIEASLATRYALLAEWQVDTRRQWERLVISSVFVKSLFTLVYGSLDVGRRRPLVVPEYAELMSVAGLARCAGRCGDQSTRLHHHEGAILDADHRSLDTKGCRDDVAHVDVERGKGSCVCHQRWALFALLAALLGHRRLQGRPASVDEPHTRRGGA